MDNMLVVSLGGMVLLAAAISFLGADKSVMEIAAMAVATLAIIGSIVLLVSTNDLDNAVALVVLLGSCASCLIQCRRKDTQLSTAQFLAVATFLIAITLLTKTL